MRSKTKCLNQSLVLHCIHLLLVALVLITLTACGDPDEPGPAIDSSAAINSSDELSDLQIAQAVYFDVRLPPGFYQEQVHDDAYYYVTSHIKNIDLLALVDRVGVVPYELSSDDFTEALFWSEQSENFQTSYKALVDNSETSLYHQFFRVDVSAPEFIYLQRILKSSVLDRSGVDDSYKGRITLVGMTAADVKGIIEYLWTFTISNNYGYAVLSSVIAETTDDFVHTMQQAKLDMSFSDSCDSIEVYKVSYTVAKATGSILKNEVLERVISAKRSGDYLQICG